MTVTVTPPPSPPPSRQDPANFAERADAYHAWLVPAVGEMNDQNEENNALHAEVVAHHQELVASGAHSLAAAASASTAATQAGIATAAAATAGSEAATAVSAAIANVLQRPRVAPKIRVDFTQKPTAAALTALGWTISRASEMTAFDGTQVIAAENLFKYSQDFDNAAWGKTAVTLSAVSVAGLTGRAVVADTSAGFHSVGQVFASTGYVPSITHRVRFLVKSGAYTKCFIADSSSGRAAAAFDLGAGATIASAFGAGYISHHITPHELGNGLYWCELVMTSGTAAWTPAIVGYPDAGATLSGNGATYTGDGTSGIEVYAAQMQTIDGAYVPTTTDPITLYEPKLGTAASGELAYDHDASGVCLGLASAPASTNICLQSHDLSNASWAKSGASVTQTKRLWAGVAPFFRVSRLVGGFGVVYHNMVTTVAAGAYYTATVAVMADFWSGNTGGQFKLLTSNQAAGLDVDSAAAIVSGPGTITRVSTGAGAAFVFSGLSTVVPTVIRATRRFADADAAVGVYIYSGTTTGSAILATRVQVELGAVATPYIPTTTAAVTRAAQSVVYGGAGFAAANNPTQGTLVVRAAVREANFDGSRVVAQVELAASTTWYRSGIGSASATSSLNCFTNANGVSQAAFFVLPGSWTTSPRTAAYAWANNSFQPASNGATVAADTSGVVPKVDRLNVGFSGGWNGPIALVELYPICMTQAQLAAITDPSAY